MYKEEVSGGESSLALMMAKQRSQACLEHPPPTPPRHHPLKNINNNYFCANSALSEFHSAMKTMHNISYDL